MQENENAKRLRERVEALCADEAPAGMDLGLWQSRMIAVSAAIGFAAALGACYGGPPPMPTEGIDSAGAANTDACEQCLESGGTWQPEANECTQNCALADTSCLEDACQGACDSGDCGSCFDQAACEAASCTWHMEAEATGCTSSALPGG